MLENALDSFFLRFLIILKKKHLSCCSALFPVSFMLQIIIVQLCCDTMDLDIQISCI